MYRYKFTNSKTSVYFIPGIIKLAKTTLFTNVYKIFRNSSL